MTRVARGDADHDADQVRRAVLHRLTAVRRHVLDTVDGIDDDRLRRCVLPSGWAPVEMLRHLALGGEEYWFHHVVGGGDLGSWSAQPRGDWTVPGDVVPGEVVAAYRAAIATSDEVLADVALAAGPRRPDPDWDAWGVSFPSVLDVVMHVIEETATHAGHLDAARELIDGHQRLVLD